MRTEELDFDLPAVLIAQEPLADRSASRLLYYRRDSRSIEQRRFSELPALLRAGDLLVFNDTRVLPARFMLRKPSGGAVEGLFIEELRPGRWHVLLKGVGKSAPALAFENAPEIFASIVRSGEDYELDVTTSEPAAQLLARIGRMPLPPYIRRDKNRDARDDADREHYQTVYARHGGAVAAPTAGLHFTPQLMAELSARGVESCFVTLHVGLGTFKPVSAATLQEHRMHSEPYAISSETAAKLNAAKRDGRRIIAVGTTSARVLESQRDDQPFQPRDEQTSIFIFPPYRWKHVSAIITNFHLPRSTLIAMIAAFVGLDEQRRIYAVAIEQGYRFYSYGDAMFAA